MEHGNVSGKRLEWRLVRADESSKAFLEDEFRMLIDLLGRMVRKEVKIAEKQIKRMKS